MMIKITSLILAASLAVTAVQPVDARRDDQGGLREDVKRGEALTQRQIENKVLPKMKGMQYLGPEYDKISKVYRLKFIDKDRVRYVDVDARTGKIIRQR